MDAFIGLLVLTIYNPNELVEKTINRIIGFGELNINFLYIKPEEVINNYRDYLIKQISNWPATEALAKILHYDMTKGCKQFKKL